MTVNPPCHPRQSHAQDSIQVVWPPVIALPVGVKLRRTWPQRFVLVFCLLLALSCFVAAGGVVYLDKKIQQVQHVALGQVLTPAQPTVEGKQAPQNILLVGVDSVEGLKDDDPIRESRDGGMRSDTIMLLRVEPDKAKASLLSFPRDLWLPIGTSSRRDKINAALSIGGPQLLISTISANFGIQVNHYVQVDFAQFQDLVDVIDGVAVPFDRPVRDEWTGLEIEEPGCVTLHGRQALSYVRSRYFEYYENGRWQFDPRADLSRIDRQQDFIKRALKRAVGKGLRNPITLNRLVNVALDSVTVDDTFAAADIVRLANRFRSFEPEALQTISLPVVEDQLNDGSPILRTDERAARPYLSIFRGGRDSSRPADLVVTLRNGSGRRGQGSVVSSGLRTADFTVFVGSDTDTVTSRTVIHHNPNRADQAELVARYLSGPVALAADSSVEEDALEVVIGSGLAGVLEEPRSLSEAGPYPTVVLTETSTTSSSRSGTPGVTTTTPGRTSTTRAGIVPVESSLERCG